MIKIGLEIHLQLNTKTKLFCSCRNFFGGKPNSYICPICLGFPGVLPVLNEEAFKKAIKVALVLNCQIQKEIRFDRKNYFYPDLPKNYQISQFFLPLGRKGTVEIEKKKIRIRRVHLEEDAGKLIHLKNCSYIDFNRAGVPLLEIVTEPDISSTEEAIEFLAKLKTLLKYLEVSDCDMEKGQLRVDTNISLKEGEKVEIKNLNSFKAVKEALNYEIKRQERILKKKRKVPRETRLWDSKKRKTFPLRYKEEEFDYRYFPEPDLPPYEISLKEIKEIKAEIGELPQKKRERFEKEYRLLKNQIEVLVSQKEIGDYFEKSASELKRWAKDAKISEKEFFNLFSTLANYLISDLLGIMKSLAFTFKDLKMSPENFAELIVILKKGIISSRLAKEILKEMVKTGADPSHIISEKRLSKISETKFIEKLAKKIILKNRKAVDDYKKGKEEAVEFLIGQMMKETKGKVEPNKAREILKELLKKL